MSENLCKGLYIFTKYKHKEV